jgi:hypothetical protein
LSCHNHNNHESPSRYCCRLHLLLGSIPRAAGHKRQHIVQPNIHKQMNMAQVKSDISLSELLESPVVRSTSVRFVCTLRKVFAENGQNLSEDDMDLACEINRLFMRIPSADQQKAWNGDNMGRQKFIERVKKEAIAQVSAPAKPQQRHTSVSAAVARPLPVILERPAPKVNYAPEFSTARAASLLKTAIENFGSGRTVTFAEFKKAVNELHLEGGKVWLKDEAVVQSNGLTPWENKLQGELKKLRNMDVIVLRPSKGAYFIF